MADNNTKSLGHAIAGGVIAGALMTKLADKGLLSVDDCRDILDTALRAIGTFPRTEEDAFASRIIQSMLRDHFPARG
jgi:hypothetical protein